MECLTLLGEVILGVEEVVAWIAPLVRERREGGGLSGIETPQGPGEAGILRRVGEFRRPAADRANAMRRRPSEESDDLLGSATSQDRPQGRVRAMQSREEGTVRGGAT